MLVDSRAKPLISVVIRNRNEGPRLARVLQALALQTISAEIILVDNESTDESLLLAEQFGARVVQLSKAEFTYGRAINVGFAAATAPLVALLSAHSLPVGPYFLASCIEPFEDNEIAAASCLNTGETELWLTPVVYDRSVTIEKLYRGQFQNCGCVVRRTAWERFPYNEELEASEDKEWAWRVLGAGYRIAQSNAVYCYTKVIPLKTQIRKYNREHVAIARFAGVPGETMTWQSLAKQLFRNIPGLAFRLAALGISHYTSLQTAVNQARRGPKQGSNR